MQGLLTVRSHRVIMLSRNSEGIVILEAPDVKEG